MWNNEKSAVEIMTTKKSPTGARTVVNGHIILFSLLISLASGQNTFKVFQNTLDPSVFNQNGGAILNASGNGFVDAFTLCMRFQGPYITDYRISEPHNIIASFHCFIVINLLAYNNKGSEYEALTTSSSVCSIGRW